MLQKENEDKEEESERDGELEGQQGNELEISVAS